MNPEILNVTDIIAYLYCPRKFYLKKIKGIKEKPNKFMIKGKIKHEIFDIFNKNEKNIVMNITRKIKKEEILELYRTEALKITNQIINLHKEVLSKFRLNSFDILHEILSSLEKEINLRIESVNKGIEKDYFGEELWENLSPKYLSEVEVISENLALKGRIDRLELGNKIIPYEIKTRNEIYEEDKLQLAGYVLILEDRFKKEIGIGIIETENDREEIKINKELKDKFLEIANEVRTLLREKKALPINSNFRKCQNCKFQDICFSE